MINEKKEFIILKEQYNVKNKFSQSYFIYFCAKIFIKVKHESPDHEDINYFIEIELKLGDNGISEDHNIINNDNQFTSCLKKWNNDIGWIDVYTNLIDFYIEEYFKDPKKDIIIGKKDKSFHTDKTIDLINYILEKEKTFILNF